MSCKCPKINSRRNFGRNIEENLGQNQKISEQHTGSNNRKNLLREAPEETQREILRNLTRTLKKYPVGKYSKYSEETLNEWSLRFFKELQEELLQKTWKTPEKNVGGAKV